MSLLSEAARWARLDVLPWTGRRDWITGAEPAFVVGSIARGERRIPADLVDLVTRILPGAPLLLLCEEELSSQTTSLHRGRVTLVGPPVTPARLYSELCILLVHARRSPVSRDLRRGFTAREHVGPRHWTAQMSSDRSRSHPSVVAEGGARSGLTVVLGLDGHVNRADAARAVAIVHSPASESRVAEDLEEALGTRAGLIHLEPSAEAWLLYWPTADAPAMIHSPLRLPNTYHVKGSRGRDGAFLRLATCESDVVLAVYGSDAPEPAALRELTSVMASGGPATADALAMNGKAGLAGLVVELRP